jgi:prepilin-type N-terminal cleavage/methylation domain-containing protein
MKSRNKDFKLGFTLMEMVVSVGIFSIVSVASLSIYISMLRVSQNTTALTRIQQESQLIMQVLSKKIRTSRVDYDYYGTVNPSGETDLVLVDSLGDTYTFALSGKTLTVAVNAGDAKEIPADNVDIDDLVFFINPLTNPYSLDEPPSSQPYVTVVMEISSIKGKGSASLNIQQTIPQRSPLVE